MKYIIVLCIMFQGLVDLNAQELAAPVIFDTLGAWHDAHDQQWKMTSANDQDYAIPLSDAEYQGWYEMSFDHKDMLLEVSYQYRKQNRKNIFAVSFYRFDQDQQLFVKTSDPNMN